MKIKEEFRESDLWRSLRSWISICLFVLSVSLCCVLENEFWRFVSFIYSGGYLAYMAHSNYVLHIWSILRTLGFSLFFISLANIYTLHEDVIKWSVIPSLIGVFIIFLGECTLYLHKITSRMTCPRCIGKGFVDLSDISRLGMEGKWGQGYCRYCDGKGKVLKGLTKRINPLSTIHPLLHDSDIPSDEEIDRKYGEMVKLTKKFFQKNHL